MDPIGFIASGAECVCKPSFPRVIAPFRSSFFFFALLLVATAAFADTTSPKQAEAAKLNNLGTAMMNQQLLDKAVTKFGDAYQLDPSARQG